MSVIVNRPMALPELAFVAIDTALAFTCPEVNMAAILICCYIQRDKGGMRAP